MLEHLRVMQYTLGRKQNVQYIGFSGQDGVVIIPLYNAPDMGKHPVVPDIKLNILPFILFHPLGKRRCKFEIGCTLKLKAHSLGAFNKIYVRFQAIQ